MESVPERVKDAREIRGKPVEEFGLESLQGVAANAAARIAGGGRDRNVTEMTPTHARQVVPCGEIAPSRQRRQDASKSCHARLQQTRVGRWNRATNESAEIECVTCKCQSSSSAIAGRH